MGGSISKFGSNFLSQDVKRINGALKFAENSLQDVTKYQDEVNKIIIQIFETFKQVLDVKNEENAISRKVLLENMDMFGKIPLEKINNKCMKALINVFTNSIIVPLFKLTYFQKDKSLTEKVFQGLSKLSKYPKLTNSFHFLAFFEDYKSYRKHTDAIIRINSFMQYFSQLSSTKFESRTEVDLFLRFIYQELRIEERFQMKSILFTHLTTCFKMKIDFQLSYLEGCIGIIESTVDKCFVAIKDMKATIKGIKKTNDGSDFKSVLREQISDAFGLIKSAYDFGNQLVLYHNPVFFEKFSVLLRFTYRAMKNAMEHRKFKDTIITTNLELMSLFIEKCGPDQLDITGKILMLIEPYNSKHYSSFMSKSEERRLHKTILRFLLAIFKWNEFVDIPYWSRKFIKFVLSAIIVSFFTLDAELIHDAVELLNCLIEKPRSHMIMNDLVDIIFLTTARYLYIRSGEKKDDIDWPSIYDIENYFEDPNGIQSAYTEKYIEFTGQTLLIKNIRSLYVFLENYDVNIKYFNNNAEYDEAESNHVEKTLESLENIILSILKPLFDRHMNKLSHFINLINERASSAKQITISNLWNKIFSQILINSSRNGTIIVPHEGRGKHKDQNELDELKLKIENLSCIFCYEYLFDNTPVCLECGHLFCLMCIKKHSEKSKNCPTCLKPFDGWVELKSV